MAIDQYKAYSQAKSSILGPNFIATSKSVLSEVRDRCCPFLQLNFSLRSKG